MAGATRCRFEFGKHRMGALWFTVSPRMMLHEITDAQAIAERFGFSSESPGKARAIFVVHIPGRARFNPFKLWRLYSALSEHFRKVARSRST